MHFIINSNKLVKTIHVKIEVITQFLLSHTIMIETLLINYSFDYAFLYYKL